MEEYNEILATKILTKKEWLTYYKNMWTRNCISRAVDVEVDKARKINTPDMTFFNQQTGQVTTVAQNLEERKIKLQEGLEILAGVNALLETPEEEFEAKYYSPEALKVAEDVVADLTPELTPEAEERSTPAEAETPVEEAPVGELETKEETPSEEAAQ